MIINIPSKLVAEKRDKTHIHVLPHHQMAFFQRKIIIGSQKRQY